MKIVELVCPDCGSENIVEWSNVECSQPLNEVILNESGYPEVSDWGISEPCWEASMSLGFACDKFCQGEYYDLEHYAVNPETEIDED
jgi:hypothetical protein